MTHKILSIQDYISNNYAFIQQRAKGTDLNTAILECYTQYLKINGIVNDYFQLYIFDSDVWKLTISELIYLIDTETNILLDNIKKDKLHHLKAKLQESEYGLEDYLNKNKDVNYSGTPNCVQEFIVATKQKYINYLKAQINDNPNN